MGVTSEQAHWMAGVVMIVVAVSLLLHELGIVASKRVPLVLPIAIILFGLQAIFDVQLHGSAVPKDYAAETRQHTLQGAITLAVGIVELLRRLGRLRHRLWTFVFPVAIVPVAVVFLMHAQHASAAPMLALFVQHRTFGVILLFMAAAFALAETRLPRAEAFRIVFSVLLALLGVQWVVYTEGGGSHAGTSSPAATDPPPASHGGH